MVADQLFHLPCHWVLAAEISHYDQAQERWLSEVEKDRLARFRLEEDRQRFTIAHSLKRFCLSKLLGLNATALTFTEGSKGKPSCDQRQGLFFNISHSGNWALLGVSTIADLGVDVESWDREVGDSVLQYALNTEQIARVKNSSNPQQQFMLYWTQKEAISKAIGLGISIDLKSLSCSGEFGLSQITYDREILHVHSRIIAGKYIASVSTQTEQVPAFYTLNSWDKSGVQLI
jgi:4'-phosphopantetheinyl transferase